jgi:hypothetical protein
MTEIIHLTKAEFADRNAPPRHTSHNQTGIHSTSPIEKTLIRQQPLKKHTSKNKHVLIRNFAQQHIDIFLALNCVKKSMDINSRLHCVFCKAIAQFHLFLHQLPYFVTINRFKEVSWLD